MKIEKYIKDIEKRHIDINNDINNKHFSMAFKGKKPISGFKHNYYRQKIFHLNFGTCHSEFSLINFLCGLYKIPKKYVLNSYLNKKYNQKNKIRKNLKKISRLNIIVIRLDKTNNLSNSKPCIECMKLLQIFKIKNITYSTGNIEKSIQKTRTKHLNTKHRCSYYRNIKCKNIHRK